jgi:hypothetical protein
LLKQGVCCCLGLAKDIHIPACEQCAMHVIAKKEATYIELIVSETRD